MAAHPFGPDPQVWKISLVELIQDRIVIHTEPVRPAVPCPECGTVSSRAHSRYRRRPRDLPWCQWAVQLVVHARKFFCDEPECPQRIFVERFPGVLEKYAHQTDRFDNALLELSYVTNAEAASRVAKALGYPTSPDTLIRRQRQEHFIASTPRVVGIDEFSMKRGRRFNTLIVDLERHRPVDMVEDRTADPVIRWLKEHPGVQVISRDRPSPTLKPGEWAPQMPSKWQIDSIWCATFTMLSRRWCGHASGTWQFRQLIPSKRRWVDLHSSRPWI